MKPQWLVLLMIACGTSTPGGPSGGDHQLVASATTVQPLQAIALHDDHGAFAQADYPAMLGSTAVTLIRLSPRDLGLIVPSSASGAQSVIVTADGNDYAPVALTITAAAVLPSSPDQVISNAFSSARQTLASASTSGLGLWGQSIVAAASKNLDDVEPMVSSLTPDQQMVIAQLIVANQDLLGGPHARIAWPTLASNLYSAAFGLLRAVTIGLAVGAYAGSIFPGFGTGAGAVIGAAIFGALYLANNVVPMATSVETADTGSYDYSTVETDTSVSSPPPDVSERIAPGAGMPIKFYVGAPRQLHLGVEQAQLSVTELDSPNATLRAIVQALDAIGIDIPQLSQMLPDALPSPPALAPTAMPSATMPLDASQVTVGNIAPASVQMVSFTTNTDSTVSLQVSGPAQTMFTFDLTNASDIGPETVTVPGVISQVACGADSGIGPPGGPYPRCATSNPCSNVPGTIVVSCMDTSNGYNATCCPP